MKKILALCLTTVLCLCCLASCGGSYSKNEFFPEEFLTQNKLADMPTPPNVDSSVLKQGNVLYLNLTKEEYEQYVEDLLGYLRNKKDIFYLGYSIGSGLVGEMLPYTEIAPITDSYDAKDDGHRFFFSTEDRLGNWDLLPAPVEIIVTRESGQLKFENYEYNTVISIYDGYRAAAMWNLCGAEHIYDEGIEYKIPGSDGTIMEYTCVHCGSTKSSDFIGDMKSYKVTIEDTDADHYIIDRRDNVISGVIVGFKTQKIIDADLKFVVNGTRIYPRETDDGKWIYEFVMPCEDIVITTEIVGGGPAPINHFLRNQLGCQWLNEISAENIAEIKIINEYVGVAPGNLKNIQSSTDEAVIARIFEDYYWLDTAPIPEQNGQIAGGSAITVKFILKDGTEKEIYINNGNYRDPDGYYFELLYTPKFEDSDNTTKTYGFISYTETCEIRCNDAGTDYFICEIPIDELEFVVYADDFSASGYEYAYFIKTNFGTFDFVSNNLFVKIGDFVPYQLVGKNLEELIAEYSTTTE